MAASYQTGTATSPINLLQTLVTWLVAQGWTQDASASDGTGWRAHLHKSGQYVNMRAAMNESGIWNYQQAAGYGIGLYLGDGYSGAASWKGQSGGPIQNGTANVIGAGMNLPAGSIAKYHFFDNGADHVTVVVEKQPGVFVHMGWGSSLVKTGYTFDCWYFFASAPSFYNLGGITGTPGLDLSATVPMSISANAAGADYTQAFYRVDAGTFAARWIGISTATGTNPGYTGRHGRSSGYFIGSVAGQQDQYVSFTGIEDRVWQVAYPGALLLPVHCFMQAVTGRWVPVGYAPTAFYSLAVGHGFGAGEIYQVGGIDYMVFPNFAVLKAA